MRGVGRSWVGSGLIAALGVALLGIQAYAVHDDLVHDNDPLVIVIVEVVLPVALSLSVLTLAWWLHRLEWNHRDSFTVARWSILALGGMLALAALELGSQWMLGDDIETWMFAISAASALALVGGVAGVERVRQRQQHDRLQESEERYRSLTEDVLDSSSVGIFILDSEFQVVWINEATAEYFGLDREDILGRDKRELIEEGVATQFEHPERFRDRVLATYDDNTYTEHFECHMLAGENREERWLEHWSQPIESGLYAGGRIEHYTDVTGQKATERELAAREEQFRQISELISGSDGEFEDTRDELLSICRDALDTEYAGLIRIADEPSLDVIHAPGDEAGDGDGEGYTAGETIPLSDGAADRLLATRETVQHRSVADALSPVVPSEHPGIGGYVGVPVLSGDDWYGVICLFDATARDEQFDEWQLALVELVADWLGNERERLERAERREQQLREEREKFGALVEDVEEYAIFTLDTDGHVTSWNRGAEQIEGYTEQEALGKHVREFHTEDERDADLPARLLATAAAEGRVEDEGWRVRADGSRFWADVVVTGLTDDGGDLRGYVMIIRDMTDRREHERRLNAVFNQTFQFTGLMEPDGTLIKANETLLSFGGFDREEVVEQPLWDLPWWLSEEDRERARDAVETAADGEFVRYEVDVQGADGVDTVDFSINPVTDETGEVVLLVPEGRVITERKQRERRLQVLYRVLRHNIRNDMTAVGGYAEVLTNEIDDEELREYAQKIHDRAQDVGQLSDRIRDIQQTIERGDEAVLRDIDEIIVNVASDYAENSEADIRIELPGNVDIAADSRFETALAHVVENAVEHNDGAVQIRIRARGERTAAGEWLRIEVADDGTGIPEQERRAVIDGEVTPLHHSSGLGLWVTKWVMETIGGELSFEESDLGGTTVVLRLPKQHSTPGDGA